MKQGVNKRTELRGKCHCARIRGKLVQRFMSSQKIEGHQKERQPPPSIAHLILGRSLAAVRFYDQD